MKAVWNIAIGRKQAAGTWTLILNAILQEMEAALQDVKEQLHAERKRRKSLESWMRDEMKSRVHAVSPSSLFQVSCAQMKKTQAHDLACFFLDSEACTGGFLAEHRM